jgi:hypothetical protein
VASRAFVVIARRTKYRQECVGTVSQGGVIKLFMSWHFWTWLFAGYGVQHFLFDLAGRLGMAPASGFHDLWFRAVTVIPAYCAGAYLMGKTLQEAKKREPVSQ